MQKGRILVVEDDEILRRVTQAHLQREGYPTAAAGDAIEALKILQHEPQDLVIADLNLPGMSGLELLKIIRCDFRQTEVVMITAFGTVVTAVEAMRWGAYDYVSKPIHLYELGALAHRVLEGVQSLNRTPSTNTKVRQEPGFENVIGESPPLLHVLNQAARVARSEATVLIQGETGTGKEVLAKAIHFASLRRERPFVTINCGAIPAELLQSELFGHMRGSFTGAIMHKRGKVEFADTGTLFLDEVGELPMELQVGLLRLIQEREIEKVGAAYSTKVDVRIIAATNRNLGASVREGSFREDLYYRLSVVPIRVPALRDRSEDIALFVRSFFERSKARHGKRSLILDPILLPYFTGYAWPGNVRQLENAIERIVLLSNGDHVTLMDLPEFLRPAGLGSEQSTAMASAGMNLGTVEKNLILQSLVQFGWNQTRAAKYLGISRKALLYRIRKYRIVKADKKPRSAAS